MYKPLERTKNGSRKLKTEKRIKQKVLMRDKYKCQLCDNNAEVVHHIIPLWKRRDLVNDMKNLMSLCTCCHNKVHFYKK